MTATHAAVTLAARVHRSGDVMMQAMEDEAVLLDMASERYFGLDAVGVRIWELLADDASLTQVHATLCAEYNAGPERIATDLLALVEALLKAGLVRIAGA